MARPSGQSYRPSNRDAEKWKARWRDTVKAEVAEWKLEAKNETAMECDAVMENADGGIAESPNTNVANEFDTSTSFIVLEAREGDTNGMASINPERQLMLARSSPRAEERASKVSYGPERSGMNMIPLGARGSGAGLASLEQTRVDEEPRSHDVESWILTRRHDPRYADQTMLASFRSRPTHQLGGRRFVQQDPSVLQDELWQPPLDDMSEPLTTELHHIYRFFCTEIENRWGCSIVEAMPLHFRAATPYSMGMLQKLHRLAQRTDGDMAAAHAALDRHYSIRLGCDPAQFGKSQIVWSDSSQSSEEKFRRFAEPQIWENTNGLMLTDVTNTYWEKQKQKQQRGTKKPKQNKGHRAKQIGQADSQAAKAHAMVTRSRLRKAEQAALKDVKFRDQDGHLIESADRLVQTSGRRKRRAPRGRGMRIGAQVRAQIGLSSLSAVDIDTAADLEPRQLRKKKDKIAAEKTSDNLSRAILQMTTEEHQARHENRNIARSAINRGFALPSERLGASQFSDLRSAPELFKNVTDQDPRLSQPPQPQKGLLPDGGVAIKTEDEMWFEEKLRAMD